MREPALNPPWPPLRKAGILSTLRKAGILSTLRKAGILSAIRDLHLGQRSASWGRCRITRPRRNWSRTCRIATWTRCTRSLAAGVRSIAGKWFTVPKLSGFCVLMTRAVYESIGGLDERFGLGLFDDDDLAERARRAGFTLAVAHDLFIHHFGSRTFVGNGIDAAALLEENARRFADKWGQDTPRGRRVALRAFETPSAFSEEPLIRSCGPASPRGEKAETSIPFGAASGDRAGPLIGSCGPPSPRGGVGGCAVSFGGPSSLPRAERKLRVSLTMIVRDEEDNLPQCLESVRGIFDEIVVVDTGSVDRTVEIAREFGARVFDVRLDRRLRRGAERDAGSRHRRLRLLARRRRRG